MNLDNADAPQLSDFLSRALKNRPQVTIIEKTIKLAETHSNDSLSESFISKRTPQKNSASSDNSIISMHSHKSDHRNNSTTISNGTQPIHHFSP